jgi:hypothetical protein
MRHPSPACVPTQRGMDAQRGDSLILGRLCSAGIQWIVQNRKGEQWRSRSHCCTKEALIRCCGGSTPELDALPDRIGDRVAPLARVRRVAGDPIAQPGLARAGLASRASISMSASGRRGDHLRTDPALASFCPAMPDDGLRRSIDGRDRRPGPGCGTA